MENIEITRSLAIPIWLLYTGQSISEIEAKYTKKGAQGIIETYQKKRRNNIYNALKWAEKNPDFVFLKIMKDVPVRRKVTLSNEEVYNFLMRFKVFMENEEFGLLTDNRPTREF